MNYLRQVQIGIDYIEANLDSDIPLQQVARAAGISQWHFQRIFKALTHETLKTYIRARRLTNSLDKLLTSDRKILDIALEAGYESQESYTRAFKKTFNMTPNAYRKIGDRSLFLKKIQLDAGYLQHINQNMCLTPELIEQPLLRMVGMKTNFYSVDSEKNNIGAKIPPLWAAFIPRMPEIPAAIQGKAYGVIQQTREQTDRLAYYAAMEVTEIGTLPADMEIIEIPAATYACFTHKGLVKQIDNTVNYIYSNWLLQSDMQHTYGPDLEIYGSDYDPVSDQSVMQYAIPVCADG